MPTVAEKQRDITQRYGISDDQFAQLFEEKTGRKFSPSLLNEDYDSLKQSKPKPSVLPDLGRFKEAALTAATGGWATIPLAMAKTAEEATRIGPQATATKTLETATEAANVAGGVVQQLARRAAPILDWKQQVSDYRRLNDINEELKADLDWTEADSSKLEGLLERRL